MSTVVLHQPVSRTALTPPPHGPALSLDTARPGSAPIPNKHIPYCPPGPIPGPTQQVPATPPASPPSKNASLQTLSLLHPAENHIKVSDNPLVFAISAVTLAAAIHHLASEQLPEPKHVFPWLHGLHAENQVQLAFFIARRRALRNPPKCFRAITIVKVGGDITRSRLKGAITVDEILDLDDGRDVRFLDIDPRDGFSVRNFQIQATKMATVSDIVVYGDDTAEEDEVHELAEKIAIAQNTWRASNNNSDGDAPTYNTFILSSSFEEIEANHPDMVAVDSQGQATGRVMDFFHSERREMYNMSKASEIANNVWLGPTPDSLLCPPPDGIPAFDIYIETSDLAQAPDIHTLKRIGELSHSAPQHLEFPSSGSIVPQMHCKSASDPLKLMCQWIQKLANASTTPESSDDEEDDSDGDIKMKMLHPRARKILIHCTDGYTESTLLALAYFMYAEQIPVHEAWLRLHCEKGRNFFAYPSDVAILASLQPRLVPTMPLTSRGRSHAIRDEPTWFSRIDGSLPSRILPYMYLGNLGHANNPELLKAMGVKRILSVGEPVNWTKGQIETWGAKNLLFVDRVQDNGVDPLMKDFERCLDFIGKGKLDASATLVHCRVGVSRSATICIAEVMASLGLSFPRAYCFVRARRLNVIIQPHLRFAYELLKWDEVCQQKRGERVKRELEWATIAREIAAMNRPYAAR
ncbi:hypothetical protein N7G274_003073 [Stereocaulon virgatum]|uniref:Protein-tyrosine-phosphatase n=1 Tax=Stereocaulon virgatum TaxID=373712 RepID=A0ABR4AF24_9LECA